VSGIDLRVDVGPLSLPTPIGLASGTCGYGSELEGLIDWSAVGAIFTKGLSLEPRTGNPPPRIWETPSGMLNAIGLENVGVEPFIRDKMPFLREWRARHGGKVIANLFATAVGEYAELARRLDEVDGVDGVEVNLSCPNVSAGGIEFGRNPAGCAAVTAAVRAVTQKLVAVKLTPASVVADVARASADAGADALSIANTIPAMAIDVHRRVPRLWRGSGGLSGPAFRPIAVRMVFEARQAVDLPIFGIGGIASGEDAVEFMLAGATAVQVGTATFADPNAAGRVRDGLVRYLEANGEASARAIAGALGLHTS
jgi:dihydroorotate dehydrogenase (NAD+) catalytic subunit